MRAWVFVVVAGLAAGTVAVAIKPAKAQSPDGLTIRFSSIAAADFHPSWLQDRAAASLWHAMGDDVATILDEIWKAHGGQLDFPIAGEKRVIPFALKPIDIDSRTAKVTDSHAFRGTSLDDPHDVMRVVQDPLTGMHVAAFIGDQLYYAQPASGANNFVLYPWQSVVHHPPVCEALGKGPTERRNDILFALRPGTPNGPATVPPRHLKVGLLVAPDFVLQVASGNSKRAAAIAYRALQFASQIFEREIAIELTPIMTGALVNVGSDCESKGTIDDHLACADALIMSAVDDADLGHMFAGPTYGDNNKGEIASACGKCRGCGMTTFGLDILAPSVDTLVHEIGHQLGARHSFNGPNTNRDPVGGFEPGLGSTLMSYAPDTMQSYRDQYFHAGSIQQMLQALPACQPGVKTCGCDTTMTTASPAAKVVARDRLIALRRTAFHLHADVTATGPYRARWEEMDQGASENSIPPFYRSRVSSAADTTFPSWERLWTGQYAEGDRPVDGCNPAAGQTCTLRFQLTARAADRRVVTRHATTVEVAAAGPFWVTAAPAGHAVNVAWGITTNAGETLPSGLEQTLRVRIGSGPDEKHWRTVGDFARTANGTTIANPPFPPKTDVQILVEAIDGSYLALSGLIRLK